MHAFAESRPPPFIDWRRKSYTATRMAFLVNILWIAIGVAFGVLARNYRRSGARTVGFILGIIGAIALSAGVLL